MLGRPVAGLPAQEAALAAFARTLTARPWTLGPDDARQLAAVGLPRPATVLAVGLVAMFNYLTRVADGTGIEADYDSPLPRFAYRDGAEAVPRPAREGWPPVDDSLGLLSLLPAVEVAWHGWRNYLIDGDGPLPVATRQRLRSIAAMAACDGSIEPADLTDTADLPEPVAAFADRLSRTPWLTRAADVDALRSTGLDDRAILHVIATVAYQSAESRLRIGLSAVARS
ncbi:MAG: hypothetical protein JO144_13560 [Actinobacteria bacterium]|nr:hypothetical protein [Actinomycetota bacterium]